MSEAVAAHYEKANLIPFATNERVVTSEQNANFIERTINFKGQGPLKTGIITFSSLVLIFRYTRFLTKKEINKHFDVQFAMFQFHFICE